MAILQPQFYSPNRISSSFSKRVLEFGHESLASHAHRPWTRGSPGILLPESSQSPPGVHVYSPPMHSSTEHLHYALPNCMCSLTLLPALSLCVYPVLLPCTPALLTPCAHSPLCSPLAPPEVQRCTLSAPLPLQLQASSQPSSTRDMHPRGPGPANPVRCEDIGSCGT